MLAIFIGLLGLLFFVKPAIAGEPPTQISPTNGSSVTSSPTLNWQTPNYPLYSGGSPYRVQVDDETNFASVIKDRYKTTTSYTPEDLNKGTWYWRVRAKDESGAWSNWSMTWSFTLTTSTTSPTQDTTSVAGTTPSPVSTPATSSSSNPSSSFTITNIPSQINSDQSFSIPVNLTLPNNKNTDYYLSGAFKKADGTRYFGLTKINSDWIKYESANYLNQYKITTDDNGSWASTLEVKPDVSDTDYKGSGDYIFKVGRYTASGSGPTWSNESIIKIISTEAEDVEDDQGSALTNTSIPSTNPSNQPTSVKTKTTTSSQSKSYDTLVYHSASVAGATASATTSASFIPSVVKNQKQTNLFIWIGLILVFAGTSSVGYIYLRKNGKIRNFQ